MHGSATVTAVILVIDNSQLSNRPWRERFIWCKYLQSEIALLAVAEKPFHRRTDDHADLLIATNSMKPPAEGTPWSLRRFFVRVATGRIDTTFRRFAMNAFRSSRWTRRF